MKQFEKTLSLITIVMALFMLVSCSKETNNKNNIVGRWVLISHTSSFYDKNGVFLGPEHGFWSLTGQVMEFTSSGSITANDSFLGTYTIKDKTLTILEEGETIAFSIENLTSSELSFKREIRDVTYELRDEFNQVVEVFYGCTQVIEYKFEREK